MTSDMSVRLLTFAELRVRLNVGERTRRRVLAELGFRRAPSRGRLLFTPDQAALIARSMACSGSSAPDSAGPPAGAPGSSPSSSSAARLAGSASRSRLARAIARQLRRSGPSSTTGSAT